ncbi:unnamed protein product [Effrenium voratum]|uniref:Uncharacterized protein n=1 Tax=Effrenium voratum TaxID=2562239 RepID=A0AA36NCK9_9DINO|nr:unnamed protein product [Effrenium voratum]CAJ1418949.1 unnamed protein product [Effrenium voratum]
MCRRPRVCRADGRAGRHLPRLSRCRKRRGRRAQCREGARGRGDSSCRKRVLGTALVCQRGEQWACLRDSDSPESKVAAACAAALTSYDVHRKAVTEPEQCDELCYVDPDAERWAQLAEVAHEEVPDVKKGNVRLQGNFLGTATTHTHQMDLNIGVNMEMPSQVAAKTMKLLTNAGLVPETQAMLDGGSKRSIFGALADYFRKDSTQDMTDDVSSMIMNSVQMKLDDVHASYEKQQKELQQALEKSQAEASSLADKLKEIQERDEQNLDTSLNQEPSEAQKVGQMPEHQNGDAKIAELTTQVRDLEAALQRHCAELEVIHTQAAKDSAARGHVENALQEAQQKLQAAEQEAQAKHSELSELKTGHARISGELESLKALPPPLDAEEVRAELQASQRQCEGLQQKLTLTEAMCRDATRRAEETWRLRSRSSRANRRKPRPRPPRRRALGPRRPRSATSCEWKTKRSGRP